MPKTKVLYVNRDTVVVTDDTTTDYINLTGDSRRPWHYTDDPYLPLTNTLRSIINEYALDRILYQRGLEIDSYLERV